MYEIAATSKTPALIIYLLDASASMEQRLGKKRRIDVVADALYAAIERMVFRSTKGGHISPRYRIAMLEYSDQVFDLLGGIKPVNEVAKMGSPELTPHRTTETAKAFKQAEKLLQAEIPNMQHCPAPIICHMTDGENTGDEDPEIVARRIMQMSVPDGNVLIENIFISDNILPNSITDPKKWPGIFQETKLQGKFAQKLQAISSVLPASYREIMAEDHYSMDPRALMLLPGMNPELVQMGFVMSAATKTE